MISTPRGRDSKFYELVSDPGTYSVHRCTIEDAVAEGYVLRDQQGEPTDLETFKSLYNDEAGWRPGWFRERLGGDGKGRLETGWDVARRGDLSA